MQLYYRSPAVISLALKLLQNNVLRVIDALHIACALEWQADLFVSSDRRQVEAAKNAGLHTNTWANETNAPFWNKLEARELS